MRRRGSPASSGSGRCSEAMRGLGLCLGLALAAPALAAPERVVSMNLCTDQLALLLAAPGQLVSISWLARDPRSSPLAAEAAKVPVNSGLAEEIYLLNPDLVLAGSFTARETVEMLRRLGVPVLVVEPAYSIAEAREGITTMGAALGREAAAADLLARLDAGLAAVAPPEEPRPTAAAVGANGYVAGPASLTGDVIAKAGFASILTRPELATGGRLSLEELLMAAPDLLVLPEAYPGWSQAEEVLHHPALRDGWARTLTLPDRNWVCGTPALLDNLDALGRARAEMP